MLSVCFYFQVHQPYRLRNYSYFDIGKSHIYEDEELNRNIIHKVTDKCYLRTNNIIKHLIERFDGRFKVSYSISGLALEQFEADAPEVIESFQELLNTGCVELINETYYHSLSYLYSPEEFSRQVVMHKEKLQSLFDYEPRTFRNTELIYNNDLACDIQEMGYKTILTEGAKQILGRRSPNHLYKPISADKLTLLLKNYRLSDDLAFRYSDPEWEEYPLTARKYADWIQELAGTADVVNLFMDYETFGEHQWAETGIFNLLKNFPDDLLESPDCQFVLPSELSNTYTIKAAIDVPEFISWADMERDTSAWQGNDLQDSTLEHLYSLEDAVLKTNDPALIHSWRKLQCSDHFYYMCTKSASDGEVHNYFNPYNSPHDAFIIYSNVLNDLERRI